MWALNFLVVIQLAIGLIGLMVIDTGDGSESVSTGETTTTTGSAAPKTTTTTAKGEPKSTTTSTTAGAKGGVTTSTTAAPRATSTTTTTRPTTQGLTPAKAGSYEYRTTYTDAEGPETTNGGFSLGAAKEQEGEVRQTRLENDDGSTTTTSYAWRADGLFLRSVTSDGSTCNFEPDLLLVASPPTVGRTWRLESSCSADGETLDIRGTSKIARSQRIAVAGRQLDTVVIETTVTEEEEDYTSRQFFSVEHGLVVREETDYEDGSSEVMELLNVDPK